MKASHEESKKLPSRKEKIYSLSKSIKDDIIIFCKKTTIHGLKHIVKDNIHPFERCFWFTMIMLSIYYACSLGFMQVHRYETNPTVVSIRKNFREWTTKFPAVTVCLTETLNESLAEKFIYKTWNITKNDEKYEYYYEYIKFVTSVSFRSNLRNFWTYEKDASLDGIELMSIVAAVSSIAQIKTNLYHASYEISWDTVMTEMGVCRTFNSVFSKYQSVQTWKELNDKRIIASPNSDKILTCNYMDKQCYAKFGITNITGTYFIHSPYEIAEVTSNPVNIMGENEEIDIVYRTTYIRADDNVRSLNILQRKCKYPDEYTSKTIPAYSNALCQMECRSRMALAFCGCRPFFFIIGDGKPCETKGMSCIGRNMEILINLPTNLAKCTCYPQCTEINYIPHLMKSSSWNSSNSLASEKEAYIKYSLQMPKVMMKRDLIFTFEDLIASFGGFTVLFLGSSFLSTVEILLLCLQIIVKLRKCKTGI